MNVIKIFFHITDEIPNLLFKSMSPAKICHNDCCRKKNRAFWASLLITLFLKHDQYLFEKNLWHHTKNLMHWKEQIEMPFFKSLQDGLSRTLDINFSLKGVAKLLGYITLMMVCILWFQGLEKIAKASWNLEKFPEDNSKVEEGDKALIRFFVVFSSMSAIVFMMYATKLMLNAGRKDLTVNMSPSYQTVPQTAR